MLLRFFTIASLLLFVGTALAGCGLAKEQGLTPSSSTDEIPSQVSDEITPFVPIPGEYIIATDDSVVRWHGKAIGKSHNGTILLRNGSFMVDDVALSKGSFVIEMQSMTEEGGDSGVVKHLKSADFFDVDAYPETRFVFTGMQKNSDGTHTISGNLTIKDQTHTITFPAVIETRPDGYRATASFVIDRAKWNVRYGSKSFFDDLGDAAIDDMIDFELDLIAVSAHSLAQEQK